MPWRLPRVTSAFYVVHLLRKIMLVFKGEEGKHVLGDLSREPAKSGAAPRVLD